MPSCSVTTTLSVSVDGTVSDQRITPLAVQGEGPDPLPEEHWKILEPLIASISKQPPDDYSQVPPPGRRAVLLFRQGEKVTARVYDRADLPESILEILGLTGATYGPVTMDFAPSEIRQQTEMSEQSLPPDAMGIRRPHPRDPVTNGLEADTLTLAVSPDHSLVVTRYLSMNDRTVVTDAKASTVLFEKPNFSLDRRFIYISHATFTPDGRKALTQRDSLSSPSN